MKTYSLVVSKRLALWSSDFPQPPLGDRGRLAHSIDIVAYIGSFGSRHGAWVIAPSAS